MCIVFLGVELDTLAMEARLPKEKLERCKKLLQEYKIKRKITVLQLESLTGLLNFACSVVIMGKPFLRKLYQRLWGLKKRVPHNRVRMTAAAKEDMIMWEQFLESYNSVSMFLPTEPVTETELELQVSVDSKWGFGIVLQKQWAYGKWLETWKEGKDTVRDLYPIIVLTKVFSHQLANKWIRLSAGNKELCRVVNEETSKEPKVMVIV